MIRRFLLLLMFLPILAVQAQTRMEDPIDMLIDVGNFKMKFDTDYGDGGLNSQYSWNLISGTPQETENFYWPQDQWQSNCLYQIFQPLVLDENGIIDQYGVRQAMTVGGGPLTNPGKNDWASETRRYRPPHIIVDGFQYDAPYRWNVDPDLEADIKLEFEDVLTQFGIRTHVEILAFSNHNHADYLIWKATHKFTGEIDIPRDAAPGDTLPDQTIRFWYPFSMSFGPSKAGERRTHGAFGDEGSDDLDSWFVRESKLLPNSYRDSLHVAYYWDYTRREASAFPNGSKDEVGDPDRTNGYLHSTQIPGYTLLHSDVSAADKTDDISQPYAMPYASIVRDLWGRRDAGLLLTYRGDDKGGRFPPDKATLKQALDKGPMRFITVGPYELTKDSKTGRYDSLTFIYAAGVGAINLNLADSIGKAWYAGEISDSVKNSWILSGKDSLFQTLDCAKWAQDRLSKGQYIPSSPPAPDIEVTSGPAKITIEWGYENDSYYNDPDTKVDDWFAWRVYRKKGALLVNDPLDEFSGEKWELVYETTDRSNRKFEDISVVRGIDYYYAVTAVDNGTQNADGIFPGQKLESSRHITRTQFPAVAYEPGLNVSNLVRVVPNPATVVAGAALNAGSPDKISFFNLPIQCKLKIFTETGDLIKTIDHYGTADEEWDQKTDGNQYVTSGIYVLAVTECKDISGNQLDNQFVKFVIVR